MSSRPPHKRAPRSYIQMAPKRAIASFENLVALANYEERLNEARKMVWRDRGEPAVEVEDLWECMEHAGRGALRILGVVLWIAFFVGAGALAFNVRVGVNLFLLVFRLRRIPKNLWVSHLRHAIFGEDSIRFPAMLGSFVFIYKFLINAFPMLFQPPIRSRDLASDAHAVDEDEDEYEDLESGRSSPGGVSPLSAVKGRSPILAERRPRLSLSVHAQQIMVRKKTRRWHAVVAGAIAGAAAVMFEKRANRIAIGQQMFVRGLQGSYNALSSKHGIRIPHGDVIIFTLACGQIIYAFLLRPDTLPRSYNTWIGNASMTPSAAISMNRDLVREGKFKLADLETVLSRKDVTPRNRAFLMDLKSSATSSPPAYGPRYGPCEAVHPRLDSCINMPPVRFLEVFKWMFPTYGALHFIPLILFRRNAFVRDPKHMLLRALLGTTRSSAFLGTFVIIYQTYFCFKHWLYSVLTSGGSPIVPQWLINILISKPSFFLGGLLSGASLFVEEKRRRGELAMYVLPKALESVWVAARGRGLVFKTGQFGEPLLTAIGMGMVMSIYQNDPQHLSGLVRRILYQFIGPN